MMTRLRVPHLNSSLCLENGQSLLFYLMSLSLFYCCKSTSCTVNVITSTHRISCKCIALMGAHFPDHNQHNGPDRMETSNLTKSQRPNPVLFGIKGGTLSRDLLTTVPMYQTFTDSWMMLPAAVILFSFKQATAGKGHGPECCSHKHNKI